MHAVPGLIEPALFGLSENEVQQMNLDEYMGRVLEKYLHEFINILDEDSLAIPVNYNEGPITMVEKIARICDIPIDNAEMEKIKSRALYHAKYPGQVFAEEALQAPVPDYCRAAYEKYEALEDRRRSKSL
jgi:hypothetical protein